MNDFNEQTILLNEQAFYRMRGFDEQSILLNEQAFYRMNDFNEQTILLNEQFVSIQTFSSKSNKIEGK